jgi:hypothetical protein
LIKPLCLITDPAKSSQIIRIFDNSGMLFIKKLLTTGVANIQIAINHTPGIYTVIVFSGGLQMSSQKIDSLLAIYLNY